MDTVGLDIARDWTVYVYDVGPRGLPFLVLEVTGTHMGTFSKNRR